jgi:hypothetical protein
MSAKLKLCITTEDVARAERFKIANPVLHKLQNTTGTLWRLCDDGLAMEIMSPFRATCLPLWALRGWYAESENGRALPCEIELGLYPLQPDGDAADYDSTLAHNEADTTGTLSQEDAVIQATLVKVLECNGWSSWRAASPQIFVERIEPFRTIVLTRDALEKAKNWLRSVNESAPAHGSGTGSTPGHSTPLRLSAALYSPLGVAPVQPITINFSAHASERTTGNFQS